MVKTGWLVCSSTRIHSSLWPERERDRRLICGDFCQSRPGRFLVSPPIGAGKYSGYVYRKIDSCTITEITAACTVPSLVESPQSVNVNVHDTGTNVSLQHSIMMLKILLKSSEIMRSQPAGPLTITLRRPEQRRKLRMKANHEPVHISFTTSVSKPIYCMIQISTCHRNKNVLKKLMSPFKLSRNYNNALNYCWNSWST